MDGLLPGSLFPSANHSGEKMTQQKRPAGMVGFSIVWIGQIVSVLASGMTAFGMTIWMYQKTQRDRKSTRLNSSHHG
jgi:hypothetical protein